MLEVPVSLVSIVEPESQHFPAQTGLSGSPAEEGKTPISHSFCQHVVLRGEPLIIENALKHHLVCDNPAISNLGVVAYLGVPIRLKNGHILGSFCAINTAPRSWTDRELTFMQDISEAVVNEIELRQSRKQLEQSLEDLKASENRRRDLIQMIVHDLRSPLNGIIGGLDLLGMSTSFHEEEQEMYDVCRESCDHLLDMVDAILQAGRIAKHSPESDFAEVNLAELLEKVEKQGKLTASRYNSSFKVETTNLPVSILGDNGLLFRALLNLTGNAFKYSPEGSMVELSASYKSISERVIVSVKDNGPGIPESDLETIFKKYQVGADKTREQDAFGLGLTFCKTVAETHGGSISVNSEIGKGSRFDIALPVYKHPL